MLIQLCYASTRIEHHHDLLHDLSDILATARAFNQAHQIYGVLYYADGLFFQCLEGEQEALELLFLSISHDLRHHHIHRFADIHIEKNYFSNWSMKYVNPHGKVGKFFKKRGLDKFLPDQLNPQDVLDFLELLFKLQSSDDAKAKTGLNHRGYQNFF